MKKYIRFLLPVLFALLIIISVSSIRLIQEVSHYGKLINYVGIVRGASQRCVKLETNGRRNDGLIAGIDGILSELMTGEGVYGLTKVNNDEYNNNLYELKVQWEVVKAEIDKARSGSKSKLLLDESEKLFDIANHTVFSIENYSNARAQALSRLIIITTVICCAGCIFVIISTVRRFIRLKKENEKLEQLTSFDELTGAYSMEKFRELASNAFTEHSEKKYALCYIDFENFKYVNDVFGYETGDRLLKKYAALMQGSLGEDEFLARNVADQFVVLRSYAYKHELLERQKRVDDGFQDYLKQVMNTQLITIACGICCLEDIVEHMDLTALMDRANFAQKTIKNNPDRHYAYYNESIREQRIQELAIKSRMQKALEDGEFIVYMQPKVSTADGKIAGAEALVRWLLPDKGLLPPGMFIPVLEQSHFIGKIDVFVFEEVCRWLRRRLDEQLPVVPVSVNVSKIQLYQNSFVEVYSGIKQKYRIPDRLIEIEFTETVALKDHVYMAQVIHDLHRKGFTCAMDDFGSGDSSLGLLSDLQVDVLKMDATFFKKSDKPEREKTIIKSIIMMLRELDICTVAEGIERGDQVAFLKTIGCNMIQGYYFYRPMPVEDFEKLIGKKKK